MSQIRASKFTPFNKYGIPTGEIKSVKDTPFDFMKPKKIGTDITGGFDGYDHNFLFKRSGEVEKVAVAHEPESGRIMAVYTDMPAMQLYTANGLGETGKGGVYFGKHHAFCLETQFTPNSPNLTNNPDFPSCVLKKGKKFKSVTIYAFGVK
jgi:aldose 1-epimerase